MPGRILIVDDVPSSRLIARAKPSMAYYDVLEAETGEEALVIAAAEEPDLILTGLQSDDAGFGQTGVVLAELLGMSHATLVMEIQKQNGNLKIKRELESGWFQYIELPTPAVLTIQSGLASIRYATIKGIMQAKKKTVKEVSLSDLGIDAEARSLEFRKLYIPQKTKETQMLEGDPKEVAAQLTEKLKNEAKVI